MASIDIEIIPYDPVMHNNNNNPRELPELVQLSHQMITCSYLVTRMVRIEIQRSC